MIFAVYIKYLQIIQYHVFDIFWHICKILIRCSKDGNILVDLKIK